MADKHARADQRRLERNRREEPGNSNSTGKPRTESQKLPSGGTPLQRPQRLQRRELADTGTQGPQERTAGR